MALGDDVVDGLGVGDEPPEEAAAGERGQRQKADDDTSHPGHLVQRGGLGAGRQRVDAVASAGGRKPGLTAMHETA